MRLVNKQTKMRLFCAISAMFLSSEIVFAVDDGARAYWKGREGSTVISFQYLNLDMQATESQQFDPGGYIYPNSDASANIVIASWARHMTVFNRPSSLAVNIAGGSVQADIGTSYINTGAAFSQSSSGYADPTIQFDINLIGTPKLKSNVDLYNYEPTWTVDAAIMLAVPIGKYESDKLVNMGLNRWFGRFALPIKYHFGVFSPGYMGSFELTPSVWIFDKNDDFMGQKLENDPMWQLESHLTQDFTRTLYGSVDLLYRSGFQSKIDGTKIGEELEIGNLGFTLNYQANDNLNFRTSYSSNVFGDKDIDNSLIRFQLVYAWHPLNENAKKLLKGH